MSETTQIHPEKVRAYLATDYRLGHSNQDIVLTVGKHSERLATSFANSGVTCGAFLTASNPRRIPIGAVVHMEYASGERSCYAWDCLMRKQIR